MINIIKAIGTLTDLQKSHEYKNHDGITIQYYKARLAVKRLSDVFDYIPLLISSEIINGLDTEKQVSIEGEVRTRNYIGEDGRSHLAVYVKVSNIVSLEETPEHGLNEVEFDGVICKQPSLRETASGRVISDLLIAHNSCKNGNRIKSYYVPALTWGSAARTVYKHVGVGDKITVRGRLQSRKYHCKNEPDDVFHWAYEISISSFKVDTTKDSSDNDTVVA